MAFVDRLDDPQHRQIYAYWLRKRGQHRMPWRRDIDPAEIPRLLPNVLISEYLAEAGVERWRYRLAGTAVVTAFGRDPTGDYADEVTTGDYRAFIERIYGAVREKQRALFCEGEYMGTRELPMSAKRLLLPVTTDGREVNQVVTHFVFRLGAGVSPVIEVDCTEGSAKPAGPIESDP
jgi:hypothetical protein